MEKLGGFGGGENKENILYKKQSIFRKIKIYKKRNTDQHPQLLIYNQYILINTYHGVDEYQTLRMQTHFYPKFAFKCRVSEELNIKN